MSHDFSLAAAHLTEQLLHTSWISGAFPILGSPNWKIRCVHHVGKHTCLKMLLLVFVRNADVKAENAQLNLWGK